MGANKRNHVQKLRIFFFVNNYVSKNLAKFNRFFISFNLNLKMTSRMGVLFSIKSLIVYKLNIHQLIHMVNFPFHLKIMAITL